MARNDQSSQGFRHIHKALLPVPIADSAGAHQESSSQSEKSETVMSSAQHYTIIARVRVSAPFLAQLAGQFESQEEARARRRERREIAHARYDEKRRAGLQVHPTVKLVV